MVDLPFRSNWIASIVMFSFGMLLNVLTFCVVGFSHTWFEANVILTNGLS